MNYSFACDDSVSDICPQQPMLVVRGHTVARVVRCSDLMHMLIAYHCTLDLCSQSLDFMVQI